MGIFIFLVIPLYVKLLSKYITLGKFEAIKETVSKKTKEQLNEEEEDEKEKE